MKKSSLTDFSLASALKTTVIGSTTSEASEDEDKFEYTVLPSNEVIQKLIQNPKELAQTHMIVTKEIGKFAENSKYNLNQIFSYSAGGSVNEISKLEEPSMIHTSDMEDCAKCSFSFSREASYTLPCGDTFCILCWNDYLTSQIFIASGKIKCPIENCGTTCGENISSLIIDLLKKEKYRELMVSNYVHIGHKRNKKQCPNLECQNIVEVSNVNIEKVTCSCGFKFCFVRLKAEIRIY